MQLKIISYNIWDLPLWFVKDRVSRIKKVAEYLAASGADIVCIQEAWAKANRPMIYEIMNKAGYMHASAKDVPMLVGNSGLITFSKYPIVSKKFTPFSRLSSSFVELFTAKGVLETEIKTPQGNLTVFNIHLHMPAWFFGKTVRLRQLRKAVSVLGKDSGPAVLAGDFNEDKMWEQIEYTKIIDGANFTNPLSVEAHKPLTYRLENEFVNIWINRSDAPCRYDYMFVRNLESIGLTVNTYKPLYLAPNLSDHDPVVLELSSN